jgi:acetyl esterase/lipase
MGTPPGSPSVHAYGPDPDQRAELWLPATPPPWRVVVLLHGGFWRARYDLDLMRPLAGDLAGRGMAAWNLEYRRVGQPGGGWPGTADDVAAGIDALAGAHPGLDLGRVAVVGHSAGGHLALWAAGATTSSAAPRVVRVAAVVSLAGVADLAAGAAQGLSDGAVAAFLGADPAEAPERYLAASPIARVPLGIPQLLVHGDADDVVPVGHSRGYAARATAAGDAAELLELRGVDHFAVIDPASDAWAATAAWLAALP